jgi:hypothetical protein
MGHQKQIAFFQNIAFHNADPEAGIQCQYADAGIPGKGEGMKRFEEVVPHSRQDP